MTEYIERQKVIDITAETGALETQRRVQEIPAADVVEEVHARWYLEKNVFDDSTWVCSSCFEPWTLIAGTPSENNMNYCPKCGAKMDLEESK